MSRGSVYLVLLLASLSFVSTAAKADDLKITSNPSGATVEMDGVIVGTTPYNLQGSRGLLS